MFKGRRAAVIDCDTPDQKDTKIDASKRIWGAGPQCTSHVLPLPETHAGSDKTPLRQTIRVLFNGALASPLCHQAVVVQQLELGNVAPTRSMPLSTSHRHP